MPNYQNSKIYALRSYLTDKIYIGSTTQALSERFRGHKDRFKTNRYMSAFEILQYPDCYIELIKLCSCNTKEELLKIEGEEIRNSINAVNKNIPSRTKKEYYKDNFDLISEKTKKYQNDNKDYISERYCDYYNNNIEHKKQISNDYYHNHKEEIKEKRKQRVTCDCGKIYFIYDKSKHNKTKYHLNNTANITA